MGRKILIRNLDCFYLVKSVLVQVVKVKFELVDGIVIMRTFGRDGVESARCSVRDDYSLYLYLGTATDNVLYCNNGLSITAYEEDENGIIYYQILDEDGFDIVRESLMYEDAVSFVDSNKEIALT